MSKVIKKSNNNSSRSIIIIIELDNIDKNLDSLEKWFIKCMYDLKNEENFCKSGEACIVSNVINCDFFGKSNKKNKFIILFQNGFNPGPLFESIFDRDEIIIEKETTNDYYLSSKKILDILKDEPEFVKKIGVSCVTKKMYGSILG